MMKSILVLSLLLLVWLYDKSTSTDEFLLLPEPDELVAVPNSCGPMINCSSDKETSPYTLAVQDDRELFPIAVNGKYGYIDVTGRVVIAPRFPMRDLNGFFEDIQYFKDGLAIVR